MARKPLRRTRPSASAGDAVNRHLSLAEFAFTTTRIATAQIIQSLGFTSVQCSALDTLTELAGKHLSAVASSAVSSTTSGGRTEANIHDVVIALEDLGSVHGFSGASNLNRRILSSTVFRDLSRFVDYSLEIPFAQAFPRQHLVPCRILRQVLPRAGHVPSWLPGFPDIEMKNKEVRKRERLFGCLSINEENGKKENLVLFDEKTSIDLPRKSARVGYINEENMVLVDGEKGDVVLFNEETIFYLPKKRTRVGFKMGVRERVFGARSEIRVCKGGKRVFCENSTEDDDENDDTNRGKKVMTMKCDSGLNRGEECGNGDLDVPLQYYRRRKHL